MTWPTRLSPSDWADRHRILPEESTADGGAFRMDVTPFWREVLDCAWLSWVRSVAIMKSTQVGGSETLLNALAYAIVQQPGPIMWVMPTEKEAERHIENRINPMLRSGCEPMREAHLHTKGLQMHFEGCTLHCRTARVAGDLSSLPIRHLIGDEVDQWPVTLKEEGGPLSVARERLRTYKKKGVSKEWVNSTPTMPTGLINQEYQAGDKRQFHLPCPECEQWIPLEWDQVKWPEEIETPNELEPRKSEVYYECQKCGHHWDDEEKQRQLILGRWVPEGWDPIEWFQRAKKDRTAHRSYRIWAAYSPWLSFADIVEEHLRAESSGDPDKVKSFTQKWLGIPYQPKVLETSVDQVKLCRRSYDPQSLPEGILWITAGVDTQKYYLPYVVRGWGVDGRSWLLDFGRAESFQDLEDTLFRRDWSGGDSRRSHLQVALVVIDARYREREVVQFCQRYGPMLVKMSKGVAFADPRTHTVSNIERDPVTGKILKNALQLHKIHTGLHKSRLAHSMQIGSEGDGPGAWVVPEWVDEQYCGEMTAEHLVESETDHGIVEIWEKKPGRRANHYFDCEALNFAAQAIGRFDVQRALNERAQREAEQAPAPMRRPRDSDGGPDTFGLWKPSR